MSHFVISDLNIWAILTAALFNMALGSLWYSRAFLGKPWMKYVGLTDANIKPSPLLFVYVFILGLLVAIFMALFLQDVTNAGVGLAYGAVIAVAFVIPTLLTHYLFEMRKGGLMLIVAGHELILFMAYGAILGGWK